MRRRDRIEESVHINARYCVIFHVRVGKWQYFLFFMPKDVQADE